MDKRKNNGGHSTKGFAGRKSKDQENRISNLMKPHSINAIECLGKIITDPNAKDTDKISACKLIIAYTYGNPKEIIEETIHMKDFNIRDLYKFE